LVFSKFVNQVKLQQMPPTSRVWTGCSLSIGQIYVRETDKFTRWYAPISIAPMTKATFYYTFIHPSHEQAAKHFVLSSHTISVIHSCT
jgi:hypothetical protein